jgi:hypothetical protein
MSSIVRENKIKIYTLILFLGTGCLVMGKNHTEVYVKDMANHSHPLV